MAAAAEIDMGGRQARIGLERAVIAPPVRRQFELVGIHGIVGAARRVAAMDIGEGCAQRADPRQIFRAETRPPAGDVVGRSVAQALGTAERSDEHTSELQSLMRNSYAVFC